MAASDIDPDWVDVLADDEDSITEEDLTESKVDEPLVEEYADNPQYKPKAKTSLFGLWLSLAFLLIGVYLHFGDFRKNRYHTKMSSCSPTDPASRPPVRLTDYISAVKSDIASLIHSGVPLSKYVISLTKASQSVKKTSIQKPNLAGELDTFACTLSNNYTTEVYVVDMKSADINISVAISNAVSTRTPAKFSNSKEISSWNALNWDYKSFIRSFMYLDQVLTIPADIISKRVFLASSKESEDERYYHLQPSKGLTNLPLKVFLESGLKVSKGLSDSSYFFSGNYEVIEELAKTFNDTAWRDLRYSEPLAISSGLEFNQTASYLTLQTAKSALQARYSEFHTVRVQLSGVGKYYIISPNEAMRVYPFPASHSSSYQAQVDFYDIALQDKLFPHAKNISVQVATLLPSEALYIPPYCYVHSEALIDQTSNAYNPPGIISYLDVLSPSLEQLILTEAGHVQAKFGNLTLTEEKVIVGQVYLVHILSRVQGISTPKKYAKTLFNSRFAPLYGGKESLALRKLEGGFNCYSDQPVVTERLLQKVSKEHVTSLADLVASALNDPAIRSSVRKIWLGNYVEAVATWAMGDMQGSDEDKAALFLRKCLQFDSKVEVTVEVEGPSVLRMP